MVYTTSLVTKTDTDQVLIEAAKKNKQAFAALYDRYHEKVYRYLYYRTGRDQDIALDLTSETFMRALNHLSSYEERGFSYLAYLMRIAHNLLVNYYRKPKTTSLDAITVEPATDPTERYETTSYVHSLKEAIAELPENDRHLLHLRYAEGLPMKEIAEVVGKSENAVKLSISRARKKLSESRFFAEE